MLTYSILLQAWRTMPLRICLALLAAGALFNGRAAAQVIPDGTLGPESSQVLPNGVTIEDAAADLIRAGARRGENLFHSFEQFTIGEGQRVYFDNPEGVARVFSRVTGDLRSDIFGTLGMTGGADLFLLNPKGIVFGPNARLDVAGSFVASTADRFAFVDGGTFNAVAPETSLLTVNVPLGLQLNDQPQNQPLGDLVNQADLAVGAGQSLTLFGNGVMSTVRLAAPGGVAQVVGNQVTLIDSAASALTGPSGDTDLLVAAVDNITVADVADDALLFASGVGQIMLMADADADGVGDVAMVDLQDALQTNGRSLAIAGVNLTLGIIDTSMQQVVTDGTVINVDAGGPIADASFSDLDEPFPPPPDLDEPLPPLPDLDELFPPPDLDDPFAPPNVEEGVTTFTFTVPEGEDTLEDLDVRFSAEHTFVPDLTAELTSPDGTSFLLFDGVGEFGGENFQDTVLDDEAPRGIETGSAPFGGSFQPEGDGGLAVFNGQSAAGTWTLTVIDNFPISSGTLLQAGDDAPWGTAQGTQLILNSFVGGGTGSGGAVVLNAPGNVSVTDVITVGTGIDGQGGTIEIDAGGDIAAIRLDASSANDRGGDITLTAGGSLQIGVPAVAATVIEMTPTIVDIDAGGPIPPSETEGTAEFTFTVPVGTEPIDDLDLQFSAEHSWDSDLVVSLTSPDGTELELFSNVGGSSDNFQDTIVDDEAAEPIEFGAAPFDGSFQPEGESRLDLFDGQPSEGIWTLTVTDTFLAEDSGNVLQAGDAAPWGTAEGTRLLINGEILVDAGSEAISGLINALGGDRGDGGQIQIQAAETVTLIGDVDASATSDFSVEGIDIGGNGGDISISSISGDVAIQGGLDSSAGGEGGAVSVSSVSGNISLQGNSNLEGFNLDVVGNAISISSDTGNVDVQGNLDSGGFDEVGDGISISSNTGDVAIDGFLTSSFGADGRAISISSNTGDVAISGFLSSSFLFQLNESGDIAISSGSGDVVIDGVVNSGAFVLPDLDMDPNSDTDPGLAMGRDGGNIAISSGSGNVVLNGPIDASAIADPFGFSDVAATSGNGGTIAVSSDSGNIEITSLVSSLSFTPSGNAGSGGSISLTAPGGGIAGSEAEIVSTATTANDGLTGAGGDVFLQATTTISGLEIVTLSSGGESGNVEIQSRGDSLIVEDLRLTTSAQVEIRNPSESPFTEGDETIRPNISNFGPSGDTLIESPGDITFENVQIQADANGSQDAGNVTVNSGGQVTFANSEINSNANSSGAAGTIRINAAQLNISNGGRIAAATSGSGDGGSVLVNATEAVFLGEGEQDSEPVISVEASGAGRPGDIVINTPNFVLSETARLTATATNTATNLDEGGSITLSADRMDLAGTVGIFAETQGQSPGGILTLQPYQSNPDVDLTLAPGARVSASTEGSGRGGGLVIRAPEAIAISGPGRLEVETSGTGRAGDIEVDSQRLSLTDGVTLSASTTGPGQAGDITFNVSEFLEIDGSTVASSTGPGSSGPGGNINIFTGEAVLSGSGQIAVDSAGNGQGGNITLTGDRLILTGGSSITATTASSDGGNLTFDLQNLVVLLGGSEISTTAGTDGAGGDGGNITLNTRFLVSNFSENSDITANAFDGDGGSVSITATEGVFGIAPREFQTPQSDITASSRNGVSGVINFESPEIDPSQTTIELPIAFVAPDVVQSCQERFATNASSFVVTGRGGIPQGPLDPQPTLLWQDLLPIEGEGGTGLEDPVQRDRSEAIPPIVEAQGWMKNERGQVVLVAEESQAASVGQPLGCQI